MTFRTLFYRFLSDLTSPVELYLKVRDRSGESALLETHDHRIGEHGHSFIGFEPLASYTVEDGQERIRIGAEEERKELEQGELPERLQEFRDRVTPKDDPYPHYNGLFGHFSYDAVTYTEELAFQNEPVSGGKIPDVHFVLFRFVIVFDHFGNELLVLENLPEGEETRIAEIEELFFLQPPPIHGLRTLDDERGDPSPEEFKEMVKKAKEHCQTGDIFQMVVSRNFQRSFQGDEFNVYRALRALNPSPYLFYFDRGDHRLFGSSPESQLKVRKGKVMIDPIAGTVGRSGEEEQDREAAERLAKDPKENAEHNMLVDLARNDLSRGTTDVRVEKYKEVQAFSHVFHMVSRVAGELPRNGNPVRVLTQASPAGTLSGAPKYKAMELIDRYEPCRRGPYGGSVGYLAFNGDLDQAITIRSFLSKDQRLHYRAGAGIVADSEPQKELEEVDHKLAALRKALEESERIHQERKTSKL